MKLIAWGRPLRIDLVKSRRSRAAVVTALAVGGISSCTPGYRTHPLEPLPDGSTRRVGCVEFGVSAGRDASFPSTSVYVEVSLENLCSDPAPVNLAALRMWADRKNGDRFELTYFDPSSEIVPLHIEIQGHGGERFRVDGAGEPGALRQVCFDPTVISGPYNPRQGAICYLFDHEVGPSVPTHDPALNEWSESSTDQGPARLASPSLVGSALSSSPRETIQ